MVIREGSFDSLTCPRPQRLLRLQQDHVDEEIWSEAKVGQRKALFTVVEHKQLLDLLPNIVALADSEKEALGFWPENSIREAIDRGRLLALADEVDGAKHLVGYVHYSGVFPHAKVQQIATQSDNARDLFGAALGHRIRLVVADEFASELKRTSKDQTNDPILQMALRLPRLPAVDPSKHRELSDKIHNLVFVEPGLASAGTSQSISDAAHIAHAALSRASAFITRDGILLGASGIILDEIGIDVISLDEIASLLVEDSLPSARSSLSGTGFSFGNITGDELKSYLVSSSVSSEIADEFGTMSVVGESRMACAIRIADRILAVGALTVSHGMQPIGRMLVHTCEDQLDGGLFADFLIDRLTRDASRSHPTAIELIHIPGQSSVNSIAQSRGFLRSKSGSTYQKIALGRPLTSTNWGECAAEIRRRTGLSLPADMPASTGSGAEIQVTARTGQAATHPVSQLAELLSPTVVIWPGHDGVLVPIAKAYASELLGTDPQQNFAFMESKDAAFLARRAYVNAPRNAKIMPLDGPILFYESKRTGGRGAIVAVARIVDRTLLPKSELPADSQRRLVVDDVDAFSATDDVLVTSFDNVFPLPMPVPLSYLKTIGAAGNANLISAVSLSSEKITKILAQGWLREIG